MNDIYTVAMLGDSHVKMGNRWDETWRLHDWFAADCRRRGVDLVCHTGDLFHTGSTPDERNRVIPWLTGIAESSPVVMVRGNHDCEGDLAVFGKLRSKHPIIVEEGCGVHRVVHGRGEDGQPLRAGVHAGVAALAWPRKAEMIARIDRQAGSVVSIEDTGVLAREGLQNVLRGLGVGLSQTDGPRILIMHAMVRGSVTSTGQPLVGCDMEICLEDLSLCDADFIGLGHIHKAQEWSMSIEGRAVPIVYTGSPRRTAYGEAEDKGYVLVTFERGDASASGRRWRMAKWERVLMPAQRMILVEDEWGFDPDAPAETPGWLVGMHGLGSTAEMSGADVRLRYTVNADQRDAARRAIPAMEAHLRAEGVAVLKVEEVLRPTTRARAPEVAAALTLPEKLKQTWKARGITHTPERELRLLDLIVELEREVAQKPEVESAL